MDRRVENLDRERSELMSNFLWRIVMDFYERSSVTNQALLKIEPIIMDTDVQWYHNF